MKKKSGSENTFSKHHTMITKGLLVLMLLIHHVFYGTAVTDYAIDTILNDLELINRIVWFCKVCISGFAFLTAFGMTRALKNIKQDSISVFFRTCVKRIIKLEMSVWMVYLLAVLYKSFVMSESILQLYGGGVSKNGRVVLYMFIDMLGMAEYFGTPRINVTWWYLSYAVLLIVAIPFIYILYRRFRYLLLPMACLLPYAVLNSGVSFMLLLPSVVLGTAFGYEGWFEKWEENEHRILCLAGAVSAVYISYLLCSYVNIVFSYTLAFIFPYIAYAFLSKIPVLRECLGFIGKHATNIFLIHTFIYYYFYTEFIYSFHSSYLIFLVLLGLSLAVSIILETVKKIFGYNHLINVMVQRVDSWEYERE